MKKMLKSRIVVICAVLTVFCGFVYAALSVSDGSTWAELPAVGSTGGGYACPTGYTLQGRTSPVKDYFPDEDGYISSPNHDRPAYPGQLPIGWDPSVPYSYPRGVTTEYSCIPNGQNSSSTYNWPASSVDNNCSWSDEYYTPCGLDLCGTQKIICRDGFTISTGCEYLTQ